MYINKSKKILVSMPIVMRKFFDYQKEENFNMMPEDAADTIVSACERISIIHMTDSNLNFEVMKEEFIKEVCDRMFDKSDELVSENDSMKVNRTLLCEAMDQLAASCEYFWNSTMEISNKMIDEIGF